MRVTASDKLDAILARGETPLIADVVDLKRFKYVYASHLAIDCGDWRIYPVYGEMSDGSSCVPDRVPDAWWAHDHLYTYPYAFYRGVRKRLSRRQCDMIYARLGLKYRSPAVFFEGLVLACGAGRRAWNRHRAKDPLANVEEHTVPHAQAWMFLTHCLDEAVWIGAPA